MNLNTWMDLPRSVAFGLLVWRLVRVKKNLLTYTLEDQEAVLTTNVPAPRLQMVYVCMPVVCPSKTDPVLQKGRPPHLRPTAPAEIARGRGRPA